MRKLLLTLAAAKALCKQHNCTLRKQDGEYIVRNVHGHCYYTSDIQDAVATAVVHGARG